MTAAVFGGVQGLVVGASAADTTVAVRLLQVVGVVVNVDEGVVGPKESLSGLVRIGHQRC